MTQNAAERVEPVEADVPCDDHIRVRASSEECLRTGRSRGKKVLNRSEAVGARWVAFADLVQRPPPLLGRRACPFGEDDGHLIVGESGRKNPQLGQFNGRVGCLAVEEVVRKSVANDVEAGIGEQLLL